MVHGGQGMDPQVLINTLKNIVEETLGSMAGIMPTEPTRSEDLDIIEYNGRMRCDGIEKFKSPSYVSVVNFYLSTQDLENHKKAKGALVVYVEFENAGKLYKNLGIPIPEDEDDGSMMNACGEFCQKLGAGFKGEITKQGYMDLVMSVPHNYKNSILEGVEFSPDQIIKHELSLFYWKRKAIVVEITMGSIPNRK